MKKYSLKVLVFVFSCVLIAYYFYNKPVDSLSHARSVAYLSADSIYNMYEQNEANANKLYLNKVITVTGKIQAIQSDTSGVSLSLHTSAGMFGVSCKMEEKEVDVTKFSVGQQVKLKGLCSGYLMDVVLVQCVETE